MDGDRDGDMINDTYRYGYIGKYFYSNLRIITSYFKCISCAKTRVKLPNNRSDPVPICILQLRIDNTTASQLFIAI
ncbi:hypothetical protein CYMTET_27441 [Cymbomonas tetramitiformis]|uniref:Uncharacterized protein n=1 Tax=Cymbomonas tetramitiformis TaxID=36881 RepID=A0AAE0KWX4_9CHLO|nr:hypothetical protein CYMTET_27441 [Cymbomonas tetramitiformis]